MTTPWYLVGAGDTFDIYDADDNLLFGVPYVDESGVEPIDTNSGRLASLIVDAVNAYNKESSQCLLS